MLFQILIVYLLMNLKERIEESKTILEQYKALPSVVGADLNKALLINQIAIMESLSDIKKTIIELAIR